MRSPPRQNAARAAPPMRARPVSEYTAPATASRKPRPTYVRAPTSRTMLDQANSVSAAATADTSATARRFVSQPTRASSLRIEVLGHRLSLRRVRKLAGAGAEVVGHVLRV